MATKTLRGPDGIRIVLDSSEIFPSDPGNGTPAMVHYKGGHATYGCAADTGEVSGVKSDYITIPDRVIEWLHDQEDAVAEFIETNNPEN